MRRLIPFILLLFTYPLFSQKVQSLNDHQKKATIHQLDAQINEWHGLAAVGDTSYFDLLSDDSFYLGTDSKEVWSLEEFKDFALPHFRRGNAWVFKTKDRNIYLGNFGNYAWFDEIIDTWMGLCRGTGVLEKQIDGWKIRHYSLNILIPNRKINEYLEIIKEE